MNHNKISSVTRILGIICLVLVVIGQLFKDQTASLQFYIPYLSVLSLVLLSISIYLKARLGGFSQYHLPIKLILIFLVILVLGIYLIYYFTT